jgi:NTE family protein
VIRDSISLFAKMSIRFLLITLAALPFISAPLTFITDAKALQRPRVGLVLSGGGAKGFAHIGMLKLLDSLQIPVDYIAGTSMGGIIGALYAIGYNGLDLEKLADRNDWEEIFTDVP